MNDEERRTTEQITRVARETYHAPPATPREEMWSAIEGRLDRNVLPVAGRRIEPPTVSRSLPWWLGIAAALVIGLGIGRLGFDGGAPSGTDGETPRLAERPLLTPPIDTAVAGDSATDGDSTTPTQLPETESAEPSVPSREETLARAVPAASEPVDRGPVRDDRPAPGRDEAPVPTPAPAADHPTDTSLPYLVATRQHLGRSESFLTSVRAELDEGGADPQVGPWARSLLVRTRLLLGSPAAGDAETRRLLEDLELMLAQIAIAAEARDPGETKILDRGLEDGSLLYRLRSATDGNIGNNARGPRASSL